MHLTYLTDLPSSFSFRQDTCLSVTHDKSLMSSKHLPQHIWLRGIFSRDLDTGATPALVDAGHAFLKRLGKK